MGVRRGVDRSCGVGAGGALLDERRGLRGRTAYNTGFPIPSRTPSHGNEENRP